MLIVGERINTSRKPVYEAVDGRDASYIVSDVKMQIDSGADLIDVNAGSRRNSEIEDLAWLIENIQKELPQARLCVDSPNPESIKAVLDRVEKVPMINSTTMEKSRFEAMAPIIQMRECDIVALCIDDRGIPKSAEQALENASKLIVEIEKLGVERSRIFVDPVIQAASANQNAALMALEIINKIERDFQGVNIISGLSNISFGLPNRHLINRTFLSLAMESGLNSAIVDPTDRKLMGTLMATAVLLGQDPWCQEYTRAFREGKLE
jgi:cobalamin-dependent methionine synthase I